ncbi:unnamed protein product [Rotaria sordida]|uniref:Transmembrane protein n=1 Tax=Rotaria sordida TaxID=392033 RepID=A0A815RMX6_9BILA|nr:unnamed protein product [Rotaria sordida]CAF1647512.1 unnamed protein product [Rotaria sordida]
MFIYVLLERYYQMSSIINFYQWRLICWTCYLLIPIHFAYKYQSRKEIYNEQLCRINNNLIQAEATFHLIQDKTQFIDHNENKEKIQQNNLIDDEDDQSFLNHTNKRHFSLLVPRSSKSTRILLGSKQINTNI